MGAKVVNLQTENNKVGLIPNHLISTGIQNIYEGITIATLDYSQDLTPLIYGSANNLVTAAYEKNGKRLILDGGFTRLYVNWDSAGTGRYVKNAAAWLVNYEKFGKEVVSDTRSVVRVDVKLINPSTAVEETTLIETGSEVKKRIPKRSAFAAAVNVPAVSVISSIMRISLPSTSPTKFIASTVLAPVRRFATNPSGQPSTSAYAFAIFIPPTSGEKMVIF